jgi:hypothetical protein
MFMRYLGGGIGHKATWRLNSTLRETVPSLNLQEVHDDGLDSEAGSDEESIDSDGVNKEDVGSSDDLGDDSSESEDGVSDKLLD